MSGTWRACWGVASLALKHGLHVGDVALAHKGSFSKVLDLPCLRVQLRKRAFVTMSENGGSETKPKFTCMS